jgi:hypothetical protein
MKECARGLCLHPEFLVEMRPNTSTEHLCNKTTENIIKGMTNHHTVGLMARAKYIDLAKSSSTGYKKVLFQMHDDMKLF